MFLGWKKRRSVSVCAWCRTIISINDYRVNGGENCSHGLCDACTLRQEQRSLAPPMSASSLRARLA